MCARWARGAARTCASSLMTLTGTPSSPTAGVFLRPEIALSTSVTVSGRSAKEGEEEEEKEEEG